MEVGTVTDTVRVAGKAEIGDIVAYEDMSNPKREYRVVGVPSRITKGPLTGMNTDYELVGIEDGKAIFSDCRQRGWTFVDQPTTPEPLAGRDGDDGVRDVALSALAAIDKLVPDSVVHWAVEDARRALRRLANEAQPGTPLALLEARS